MGSSYGLSNLCISQMLVWRWVWLAMTILRICLILVVKKAIDDRNIAFSAVISSAPVEIRQKNLRHHLIAQYRIGSPVWPRIGIVPDVRMRS